MVLAGRSKSIIISFLFTGPLPATHFPQLLVSWNLRGTARHIVRFPFSLLIFASISRIALYRLEKYRGIQTIKDMFNLMQLGLATKLVFFVIIFCLPIQVIALFIPGTIAKLLSRFWPQDEIERISQSKYIGDHLLVDAETSLDLVYFEQDRVSSDVFGIS